MEKGYAIHFIGNNSKTGKTTEMYAGMDQTFIGIDEFKPYKTKKEAKGAITSWEKLLIEYDYPAGWEYEAKSIVSITDSLLKKIEKQTEQDMIELAKDLEQYLRSDKNS